MKKSIVVLLMLALLTGCGSKNAKTAAPDTSSNVITDEDTENNQAVADKPETSQPVDIGNRDSVTYPQTLQIDTRSAYKTSYRQMVGEELDVLYLGMPMVLKDTVDGSYYVSSDPTVAAVVDGKLHGLKEGTIQLQKLDSAGNVLSENTLVVTTFNDGKHPESTYEIGLDEIFNSRDVEYKFGIVPGFLKTKINTIQDVIAYIQGSYMEYEDIVSCITDNSCWMWAPSGETTITHMRGCYGEMINLASYLLQNDFEEWGYIMALGYSTYTWNIFYEDGYYYVMDFYLVLRDASVNEAYFEYEPFKAASLDEVKQYIMNQVDLDTTLTIVYVRALGRDQMPAVKLSFLHNSLEIMDGYAEIGMEKLVYDNIEILYSNQALNYNIVPIPTEEIPEYVPRYGAEEFWEYHY